MMLDSLERGGAQRHVVDVVLALVAKGYDIDVAFARPGPLREELVGHGVQCFQLTARSVKRHADREYSNCTFALLQDGDYGLVHSHMYASSVAAYNALRGTSLPLVVTLHSEGLWQSPAARALSGRLYRHARVVIAVSGPLAESAAAAAGFPSDRIARIPNAVRPLALRAGPAPRQHCRESSPPRLGVIARLEWEKGIDVFLQALTVLRARGMPVQALIAGDGSLRRDLRKQASRLCLEDTVLFLGELKDAESVLHSSRCLVVPSRSEGSPLVVLEAMTAGIPLVATTVGGIPDQVRHGRDGLLVPPEDPEALAEAIRTLLEDPILACRLADSARRRVSLRFSHRAMIHQLESVYARALGRED